MMINVRGLCITMVLMSGVVCGMEKKIVCYGRPPRSEEVKNRQCMLIAVADNDIQDVQAWIKKGYINRSTTYTVKSSTQEFPCMMPLMVAAFHGHSNMIDLLIKHKATLKRRNGFGNTALYEAENSLLRHYTTIPEIQSQFDEIIRLLTEAMNGHL